MTESSTTEACEIGVLMELRHRTIPPVDAIARMLEAELADVEAVLAAADAAGHVEYREGEQFSGFILTAPGLDRLELSAPEVAAATPGAGERLAAVAAAVEAGHAELLTIIVDWRVRTDESGTERLNDHADAAYDRAVIGRLEALHTTVGPVIDGLALCLPRYRQYRSRLDAALNAVRDGRHELLAKPIPTSYVTTWFDLRGDVSLTLDQKS